MTDRNERFGGLGTAAPAPRPRTTPRLARADQLATEIGVHGVLVALILLDCPPRLVATVPAGRAWRASCPAPGCERGDALGVTETSDGRVLVRCGGCRDHRTPLLRILAALKPASPESLAKKDRERRALAHARAGELIGGAA